MRRRTVAIAAIPLIAVLASAWYFFLRETGDPRLAPFVKAQPAFSVVFTSRSEPASLRAAAEIGDYSPGGTGARGTGQSQWQAREGRLRILSSGGSVRELTWGRPLPEGGTLVDVMSPSVSPDGSTIVFAGRRADAHGGRFRIYSVNLDGSDLKPLTGTPDDSGCVRVPPLRFGDDGQSLRDDVRSILDFDDVDPALLPEGTLVFASSRQPDTGGRDRRATQIWEREPKQVPRPLTSNRANDRWPYVAADRSLVFSIWSKQDEVISADGTGLSRGDPRGGLTAPSDHWFGASISPTGESFAQVAKVPTPVWRPRPLENGNIAFMTTAAGAATPFTPANEHPESGTLRVAQSALGYVASAPSSLSAGAQLPEPKDPQLAWLNASDETRRPFSIATPSPIPGGVLVAAAPVGADGRPNPRDYGLYTVDASGWPILSGPSAMYLMPLFDDPDLVDAEPVAVYERPIESGPLRFPTAWPADEEKTIPLASGRTYRGPAGKLHGELLTSPNTGAFPGQTPKAGDGPIFPHFAQGSIAKIAFYSSHRDRYDDPGRVVVRGELEKLLEVATNKRSSGGGFEAMLPAGSPTLLIGLGSDGKVVTVPVPGNNRASFYAFAGDHVSGIRVGGYHFCTGCHTGHTFTGNAIAEKRK